MPEGETDGRFGEPRLGDGAVRAGEVAVEDDQRSVGRAAYVVVLPELRDGGGPEVGHAPSIAAGLRARAAREVAGRDAVVRQATGADRARRAAVAAAVGPLADATAPARVEAEGQRQRVEDDEPEEDEGTTGESHGWNVLRPRPRVCDVEHEGRWFGVGASGGPPPRLRPPASG